MSAERGAVIYVESGTSLRASTLGDKGKGIKVGHHHHKGSSSGDQGGGNYVIKIQIGEENMFNPVRIDVSAGKRPTLALKKKQQEPSSSAHSPGCGCGESPLEETSSSSGQSSPRSDMTPPPPRMSILNSCSGGNRFGSETSESDTESDISSEFRPLSCQAAQFAMREICETPSPPLHPNISRSIIKKEMRPPPLPETSIPISNNTNNHSLNSSPAFVEISNNKQSAAVNNEPSNSSPGTILGAILTLSESMALKRAKSEMGKEKKILVDESGFHVNEINGFNSISKKGLADTEESMSNFAGYRDIFSRKNGDGTKQILSDRGTIRGVKNRVRDGIATFLQSKDTKTYSEKEQGRVVVYVTSMGVVRATFLRCQKVKQILRNLLIKFDERDCYMNRAIQNEIRQRLPQQFLALPQVFLEGQLLGDAEVIEKLNETGELRDLLKPYKSLSVLSTCEKCGGFRMLPCPICNGSKKSVHRNHFTTEFIALKCMHCDPSGLVRCDLCNAPDP